MIIENIFSQRFNATRPPPLPNMVTPILIRGTPDGLPICPGCGAQATVCFRRVLGLPLAHTAHTTKALTCETCDHVYVVDKAVVPESSWWSASEDGTGLTLPIRPVTGILPASAKMWSDGTPFIHAECVGSDADAGEDAEEYEDWKLSLAHPSLKTPQTSLVPDWSKIQAGPLLVRHFFEGSAFLQFDDKWAEVKLEVVDDDWTDSKIASNWFSKTNVCCRPSVPSHGIIFRYDVEVEDNNGTALVSLPDQDWMHTVMNSPHIVWCICTNCSSFFENMSEFFRGCYSSHFMLSCCHCNATMLFDVQGEMRAQEVDPLAPVVMHRVDGRHVFLPAKCVASVHWDGPDPESESESESNSNSDSDSCRSRPLPCASTIVNLPAVPYPDGTNLSADNNRRVYVTFADGTTGVYTGD